MYNQYPLPTNQMNMWNGGYQQPMQGQYNQPQQATRPPQTLIKVNGIDGARAYNMPENSVVALFDGQQPLFYIKETDGAGFPTIKIYEFKVFEEPQQQASVQQDYVTRAEFEDFIKQIQGQKDIGVDNG